MVNAFVAKPEPMSAPSPAPTPAVTSKPVGRMPRGSGIEWSQLPAKYHRKPISQEEIEFIEVSKVFFFPFELLKLHVFFIMIKKLLGISKLLRNIRMIKSLF